MIRHHRRALIVASSDLIPSDVRPAWADEARGMGRRVYDSWAACLPALVEQPPSVHQEPGQAEEDASPPRAPGI